MNLKTYVGTSGSSLANSRACFIQNLRVASRYDMTDDERERCRASIIDIILFPMLHIYQQYVAMIHIILPLSFPSLSTAMRIEIAQLAAKAGHLRLDSWKKSPESWQRI